ncbi:unnamed protein product [Gongylonema pulchrum]|uniref:PX domain-containing protein n=1 Tax=Gongylonema pulchrum TaxID=637853 RepID=A0A183EVP0_9BILA|nr:unnamed protein product [Gongylonema pulchrum]
MNTASTYEVLKAITLSPPSAEEILERRRRRLSEMKRHQLPSLGFVPDAVSDPNERRERLEKWLQAVLHIPVNRNHHETAEFLEVSRFSFINELGGKYCESFVKKRPGGARVFIGWKQFCVRHCLRWSKRWLILKVNYSPTVFFFLICTIGICLGSFYWPP